MSRTYQHRRPVFTDLIERTEGCWVWHGTHRDTGYPTWGAKMAHRAVYEHLRGPIAPKMTLDHLCRNVWCINPDHMEEVSLPENAKRAMEMVGWKNRIRRFLETGRYESSNAVAQRRYKAKRV